MAEETDIEVEGINAEPEPDPVLSIGRGIKLMLLGWTVGLAAAGLAHLALGKEATSSAGNIVGLSTMAWVGYRMSRRPFRSVFSIRGFSPSLLVPMVLMVLGGSMIVAELGNLMEEIVPVPQVLRELFLKILRADDWQGFLWRAALLSLMAPVTEEVVFRGVFQHGFVRRYGVTKGIVASSICFGVFHLIPWQAVSTSVVGLMLGLVVLRTGSIFAGMAMHAIWNLVPLVAISLLRDIALPGYDLETPEIHHVPLPALMVSSVLLWLGIRGLWRRTEGLCPQGDTGSTSPAKEEAAPEGPPPVSSGDSDPNPSDGPPFD
jgi:membrane protease YdiL (CAAX protease family)